MGLVGLLHNGYGQAATRADGSNRGVPIRGFYHLGEWWGVASRPIRTLRYVTGVGLPAVSRACRVMIALMAALMIMVVAFAAATSSASLVWIGLGLAVGAVAYFSQHHTHGR